MAVILPGTLWRESEFQGGLTGACGPNALSFCASWSRQRYTSTLDVYRAMRAERPPLCDANGVSTIGGLRTAATLIGLPLVDTRWYAEPWGDWRAWFSKHLSAGRIILLEVANGQALVDSISGKGENARNLKYHFIACAGRLSDGSWLCLDGDNFASGNVHQVYRDSVLGAARPCAALAIGALAKMSNPYEPVSGSDWMRDKRTGHTCGGGVYARYVVPHGYPLCTMTEHAAPGKWGKAGDTITGFSSDPTGKQAQDDLIYWSAAHGNVAAWDVHVAQEYEAIIASLTKALDDAKAATHPSTPATPAEPSKADELVAAIKAALAAA